ncbi:MAG: succinyl-diaminopimelate desuccinylase [Panacagrimonas sp.]|nr:succinyl-diaminopimelate desuccinylase [Panacagrimonas sp.]MCC2654904.1 succinyl-diaminopimelate desuccinylase [Panacagrimonas sp.]
MNAESPSSVLDLTCALIARRSNTPDDAGCCEVLASRLRPLGFSIEYLDAEGVTNLWATRGSGRPLTILAGHTDIVPTGPLEQWSSDPFVPSVRDGVLYGRGAADMKSGLAAMTCAVERLLRSGFDLPGTLAFLVTSDEEGMATWGTQHAVKLLQARGLVPDYAVVGEASSSERLGDRIVVGRRGSLGCNLRVIGKQAHVAYPHKGDNAVHRLVPALAELVATRWDEGNAHFPPTSFQVSNFRAGTGASNVIPGAAEAVFNFRYSTESRAEDLKARVHAVLDRWCPQYEADWWHTGQPFLTRPGRLIEAARAAIGEVTGITEPELFTGGGTSDARFLAPWGAEVVEIGPINDSIHKIDEHVRVADLEPLSRIYEATLRDIAAR